MSAKVHHRERVGTALQPFFDWWEHYGTFDLTVPESGGNRTDEMQLHEWMKGRQLLNGVWHETHPELIVTHAMTAEDSAHGHCAGADVYPVRTHFGNGLPASVWTGGEKDLVERAEAHRLQMVVVAAAKAFGLDAGADWASPKTDVPHLEARGWRALPRFIG